MAQLYGPPSDGSVIPHDLEDAIAADVSNDSRPIGAALRAAGLGRALALPTMLPVVRALDAGQSTGVWFTGDSTGDTDGTDPAADRTAAGFARDLGAAYPSHHVLFKHWDATVEDYKPWTVMQEQPEGRRFARLTARTLRYVHATPPEFTTGTVDVRALVAPDSLTPAARGVILARARKEVDGALSNAFQFELFWHTDGRIGWHHSIDGGAAFISDRMSTVPVPATAGAPIWVRATMEYTDTGFAVNFYTSPAGDGVTWTKLGDTVVGGSSTTPPMSAAQPGSFFEIGGRGWQPVADAFLGNVYEVQIRDGLGGATLTPSAVEQWERYGDPSTTFGGAPTLYFLNASRSSAAMSYHTDPVRLAKETPDYGQTVLVFNDSHNEVSRSGSTWIPPYEAWVAAVQGRTPNTTVNVIGQNPHTAAWGNEAAYGAEHVKRIMELSATAPRKGWGFINVYQAFLDDPRGLGALVGADGLHPTPAGYELAADTVTRAAGLA